MVIRQVKTILMKNLRRREKLTPNGILSSVGWETFLYVIQGPRLLPSCVCHPLWFQNPLLPASRKEKIGEEKTPSTSQKS